MNRRQFVKDAAKSATLAGFALGGIRSASAQTAGGYTGTSADSPGTGYYDPSKGPNQPEFWPANSEHPGRGRTPMEEMVGIITPNRKAFVANHRDLNPNIDARKHRLLVHGLVDRPMMFTMDDLKRLPSVSRVHYVACAGQSYLGLNARKFPGQTVGRTHGGAFCADHTGVLLSTVLERVGVQKGANWMVAESVDVKKHAMDIPLSKGWDDALLAYGENGEPVSPGHGYPLRLIAPGFEGSRNVKWLGRIKITDRPYWTYYENVAYHNLKLDGKARNFQFEMEPGGTITFPSGSQQLPGPGWYEIRGLAWSGGGTVTRVEVSTDGGRTWTDAKLNQPVHRKAFTMFTLPWKWEGQEAVVESRTTDDNGDIQPSLAELTQIWRVTPDYWQTATNWIQHFNAIQPWRIARDGRVTNGMFHPENNSGHPEFVGGSAEYDGDPRMEECAPCHV